MTKDHKKTPNGFILLPHFINELEEEFLISQLKELSWQSIQMHGVTAKRRVVHFGYHYKYSTRQVTPTDPIPSFLQPIINRAAVILKINPKQIVEVLITEYPSNAGIGWHRDAPIFETVFGISLNAKCILKLRSMINNKWEIVKQELLPCSAYVLSDEARHNWQHSIPPVKEKRYSITFRTLK